MRVIRRRSVASIELSGKAAQQHGGEFRWLVFDCQFSQWSELLECLSHFGLGDGSPAGVSGGGITGILAPEGGGVTFIFGSTSAGGVITPPERLRSELLVPLAGGSNRRVRLIRTPGRCASSSA